ncbi:related to Carrier protein YMC1, mitochondrial precursor [Melanopsichium pennsylvanicum]|uniref:Related to Carrier protein YMC1, mitochondrial n=2 Tax=Melanopsichium pennsylvanicum TaxID=63383 RepID=A0AAJ4XMR6_9BASI|nr:related to Carrier protein YMC1, mitochondrial precursor [Melanopsichium pennsylvanicum 4]SNX85430.1 related to Carrier protein YMC1, mitochondrial precursor [Melanopsichium pennsylvanicum]
MTDEAGPSAMVDFVAGTVGGIVSLLAGHPFDTVKTRLQAQPSASSALSSSIQDSSSLLHKNLSTRPSTIPPASSSSTPLFASTSTSRIDYLSAASRSNVGAPSSAALNMPHMTSYLPSSQGAGGIKVSLPIYRSATDAFRIIIREEHFLGLYKGVTSPMLGVALMNASIFTLYSISLRYQNSHRILDSYPIAQVFVAGMVSGFGSSLITSPIDLIKIREQMNTTAQGKARPNTFSVFKDVLRKEGLFRGIYRGWCTTAVRDLGYGPYFASYELLNSSMRTWSGKQGLSNIDMAFSGAVAGVVAWVSTFWADVIKTKIQATSGLDDKPGKRSLFWSTARATYTHGGWRAFFVGMGPTVIRALPVNAVLFVSYEITKDFLIKKGY